MSIILYHGSDIILKKPAYGKGKDYNDYGKGFYTTIDKSLACEWAVDVDRDGYVNIYEFDDTGLKYINLNNIFYTDLNWIALLASNRVGGVDRYKNIQLAKFIDDYNIDISKADFIIGYRADDRYFRIVKDFFRNEISLGILSKSLRLGDLGQQYCLKSSESFERIKFLDAEKVCKSDWLYIKKNRLTTALSLYDKLIERWSYDIVNKISYGINNININNILNNGIDFVEVMSQSPIPTSNYIIPSSSKETIASYKALPSHLSYSKDFIYEYPSREITKLIFNNINTILDIQKYSGSYNNLICSSTLRDYENLNNGKQMNAFQVLGIAYFLASKNSSNIDDIQKESLQIAYSSALEEQLPDNDTKLIQKYASKIGINLDKNIALSIAP